LSLALPVIASAIPAHMEQLSDPSYLFDPRSPTDFRSCVARVTGNFLSPAKAPKASPIDYDTESASLIKLLSTLSTTSISTPPPPTIVIGPAPDQRTGIAVYNAQMMLAIAEHGIAAEYLDPEAMDEEAFFAWLENN